MRRGCGQRDTSSNLEEVHLSSLMKCVEIWVLSDDERRYNEEENITAD
ncbi:hypothetical protein AVP43_00101 [Geobacillus stearothermophilus]|nr:hypothetical protein AVP43_00101 [Geobacillus stearothermophilus]